MTDLSHTDNVNYLTDTSPLWGTSYATILQGMIDVWTDDVNTCSESPIWQVPNKLDITMHTRNCPNVHRYLNDDRYDLEAVA